MRVLLSAIGVLCCSAAASPAAAQEAAIPHQSSQTGPGAALRAIDADLAGKIGFNNPSYAELVASTPPVGPSPGARVERFTAPNGRSVTVAVAAPIQPGTDPARYFAETLSRAGAHDVVLQGNTLKNTNTLPPQNNWNAARDLNAPIVINDASNILLLHNTISGGRPISVDRTSTTGVRNSAEEHEQGPLSP